MKKQGALPGPEVYLADELTPRGLISLPGAAGRRFSEIPGDSPAVLSRRLRRFMERLAAASGRELAWLGLPPGYTGEDLAVDLRRRISPGQADRSVVGPPLPVH
jgi:hypothetical protein